MLLKTKLRNSQKYWCCSCNMLQFACVHAVCKDNNLFFHRPYRCRAVCKRSSQTFPPKCESNACNTATLKDAFFVENTSSFSVFKLHARTWNHGVSLSLPYTLLGSKKLIRTGGGNAPKAFETHLKFSWSMNCNCLTKVFWRTKLWREYFFGREDFECGGVNSGSFGRKRKWNDIKSWTSPEGSFTPWLCWNLFISLPCLQIAAKQLC